MIIILWLYYSIVNVFYLVPLNDLLRVSWATVQISPFSSESSFWLVLMVSELKNEITDPCTPGVADMPSQRTFYLTPFSYTQGSYSIGTFCETSLVLVHKIIIMKKWFASLVLCPFLVRIFLQSRLHVSDLFLLSCLISLLQFTTAVLDIKAKALVECLVAE